MYGQHIADVQYCRRSILQTFNVATVADAQCCNQTINIATISVPHSKRSSPPKKNSQVHIIMFMHIYGNDTHNLATNVLLTQQFFTVLFFLVKFKTMGLTVEPGLATKLCAKALSSK